MRCLMRVLGGYRMRQNRSEWLVGFALLAYYLLPTGVVAAITYALTSSVFWSVTAFLGTGAVMILAGVTMGCD